MYHINFFHPNAKPFQRIVLALLFLLILSFNDPNAFAQDSVVTEENIFSSTETDDDGLNNLLGIENEEEGQIESNMNPDLTIDNDI